MADATKGISKAEEIDLEDIKDDILEDDKLFEDNPELLEMRKKLEAENLNIRKNEDVTDLDMRLEKEIQEMEQREETKVVIEDINAELNEVEQNPSEPISGSAATTTEATSQPTANTDNQSPCPSPERYNNEVDALWNLYVENARIEEVKESETKKLDKEEEERRRINKVLQNPFLQKMVSSSVPSSEANSQMADYTKYLLYPLLLENYKIHANIASDYVLRKHLQIHEFKATNKYNSLIIK